MTSPAPASQPTPTAKVLLEVFDERLRQDEKWGEQNHPDVNDDPFDRPILSARTAKQRTDERAAAGVVTWTDILIEEVAEAIDEAQIGNVDKLRTELIQVAAVATQWVQAIDRRPDAEAGQ